ncbi:MAG: NAD(P)/FAD-dependent oxidoreductase, partial [Terriglobus roseus]|nr:NAD(P)/FAD-dependent oxidoreductase [Terriglobus roseus]
MDPDHYDLVITGAGIHGLILAKTYLESSPTSSVLIIDSAASIGGVWAAERLYPGLKTNNLVGSYEFSDFPLNAARYGLKAGQHIPGPVVHEYLKDFAERFDLTRHVRFNTLLETAERLGDGSWRLTTTTTTTTTVQSGDSSPPPPSTSQNAPHSGPPATNTTIIHTTRLVLATGLTSQPSIPQFPAQATFDRPILHSLDLRRSAPLLSRARRIVVLGGNKSAFDAAYGAATSASGTEVHMVMRPSGGGPSWVWPVTITPFSLSVQRMATTRLFALMDPTPWILAGSPTQSVKHLSIWILLRYLLHRTFLGRVLVTAFWAVIGGFITRANGYASHPELAKLRPWTSVAWMGNSLSIHNYATDFFALVRRGRIKVHVADIARLGPGGAVYLSDGEAIGDVDALVCCTGWQVAPTVRFLPEGLAGRLGVPGPPVENVVIEMHDPAADITNADVQAARAQIRRETPMLRHEPTRTLPVSVPEPTPVPPPGAAHKQHQQDQKSSRSKLEASPAATCWRLYRFLIPIPSAANLQRNIAFMGTHLSVAATLVAQAQAL